MYFYQLKHGAKVGWVSLNGIQHDSFFTVYSSSFKGFKNHFFKVFSHQDPRKRIFESVDDSAKFPSYWQRPCKFKLKVENLFREEEKVDIALLKSLPRPINSRALLKVPMVENPTTAFVGESRVLGLLRFLVYNFV